MSEPRFSDKVERTQKAGLANPDKDVSLYIRSPGSSDREKFGRIVGRKLILPPASTTLEESITPEWDAARKLLECVLKPPSRIRNAGWAVPSEEIFVAKQCAFLHAASRAGVKMSSE